MNDTVFMFSGADPTYGNDAAMFSARPSSRAAARRGRSTTSSVAKVLISAAAATVVLIAGTVAEATEWLTLHPETRAAGPDGVVPQHSPRADVDHVHVSDHARCVAHAIIEAFSENAPDACTTVTATDDDGITIEFEDEDSDRTVVYVIPHSGRNQFVVIEDGNDYWAGKITRDRAHRNLARWLRGELGHHTFKGVEWAK